MDMDNQQVIRFASALIGGEWRNNSIRRGNVINPANGESIGFHAIVSETDIREAIGSARDAFKAWRQFPAPERSKILLKAAALLSERREEITKILTLEQGKPLREAREEVARVAETFEWYGQEARRIQGRLLQSPNVAVRLAVERNPVGPVAAFTPWNFPLSQAARKLAAALAAGCSVILKGSEEAPFCCVELVQALVDSGLPNGLVQLLFGDPAQISDVLIPDPAIRKVSFTGSVPVGRVLAAAAGQHLKYATMELGGHAPAIVFADAPQDETVRLLVAGKYRNAGQVCASPTRLLVETAAFEAFVSRYGELAASLNVGDGFDEKTDMGPLIHERRLGVMEGFVADAVEKGATLVTGGRRIERAGFFFEPTVLADVPPSARIMNEEPFGPIAIINPFGSEQDALEEANRLPYGLASFLYTSSGARIRRMAAAIEAGVVSVNGESIGLADAPFGGVKDSGFGREGGIEGMDEYLVTKFIAERTL